MSATPSSLGRVGPYELLAELGRGGMGAVYRGRHVETGAPAAVKLVRIGVGPEDRGVGSKGARALARFAREVEALARVDDHPGIVRIHTQGITQGGAWCAMDLVAGQSVGQRLARGGPLPPRDAATLVASVAHALQHVHERGVVHRDLKPENILLDERDGTPRIVDFGIAYDVFAEHLTRTGELVGTPAFMAPEQVRRTSGSDSGGEVPAEVGPAADVYGAGAVLFATLTGRPPFERENVMAVLAAVVEGERPLLRDRDPSLPAELEAICLRALAVDPADRYESAAALAADLERWLRGESVEARGASRLSRLRGRLLPKTRRAWAIAAAVAMIGALGVAAGVGLGRTAPPPAESVERLERALGRRGPLDDRETETLEQLLATPTIDDAALARRLRTVELAARIARHAPGSPEALAAAAELAADVRDGGEVDRIPLDWASDGLAAARRPAELNVLLHGLAPVVPVALEHAPMLAAALAVGGPGLEPPLDATAFAAIRRAGRLDETALGQIQVRRAASAARAGASDVALDALTEAAAAGVFASSLGDDPSLWPDAFIDAAHARIDATIAGEDPASARPLVSALLRLPDSVALARPLPAALVGRFQLHQVGLDRRMTDIDDAGRERIILSTAFLERYGDSKRADSLSRMLRNATKGGWIERRAEAEMRLPLETRDPSVLLVLAMLYAAVEDSVADPASTTETMRLWEEAAAIPVDARGIRALRALLLHEIDAEDADATTTLREIIEIDRGRPIERRWGGIASTIVRWSIVDDRGKRVRVPAEDLPDLVALTIEALQVWIAAAPRLEALADAGAYPPWVVGDEGDMVEMLEALLPAVIAHADHADWCCLDAETSFEALIDLALKTFADLPRRDRYAPLLGNGAMHDLRHRRFDRALERADAAIAINRPMAPRGKLRVLQNLRLALQVRAKALRALGRDEEAAAAEEERAAIRFD